MARTQLTRFDASMTDDVAALIHNAFAEHQARPPLSLLWPPAPWTTIDELAGTLAGDAVCAEASHVALTDGRPVAAAIAAWRGDSGGWWHVATAAGHRRQGLARRCIEAGERALRTPGQALIATEEEVDSRWTAAEALFAALGYRLDDPERRNISMMVEDYVERPIAVPDGYELTTFTDDDLDGWTDCRNAVFGSDAGPEWFREHFQARPDFDPAGWFLVKHEGRIVGMSGALDVAHMRDPEHLSGGQIEYVAVRDEHRGHHLGELVVTACLNWLAQRGVRRSVLITQPFRVPAIRLYEKLGFHTIGAWHRWVKCLG